MKTTVINSNKENGLLTAKNVIGNLENKDEKPKDNVLTGNTTEEIIKNEAPAPVREGQDQELETADTSVIKVKKPTKMEIKDNFQIHKPVRSLEETLKLVKDLADKTALRDTYTDYIESLTAFAIARTDEDDMGKSSDPSFKGCELVIKDHEGNVFKTYSPSVIHGTVEFMKGRFSARLAEVESEIVIPG